MTAINRTAYPRLDARLNHEELAARYTLTDADHAFVRASSRGETGRLVLAMLLKARQDLGYFPALEEVHVDTVAHLSSQLGRKEISIAPVVPESAPGSKSLYRYQAAVRAYLSATPYGDAAEELVSRTTLEAAEVMSDPADLINRAVETLQIASIDLPAFSTLDRLVNRLRAEVHERMYLRVSQRVTAQQMAVLETLLVKPENSTTTPFNRLKQTPGPATPATIRLWVERLDWLVDMIDSDPLLEGIAYTKLRQFAAEAAALDVGDLRDIVQTGKRHTLLLALVRQARMRCRDELVKMLLRRMRKTQSAAKQQLTVLQDRHREIEESLIGILGQVLQTAQAEEPDAAFGRSCGVWEGVHILDALIRNKSIIQLDTLHADTLGQSEPIFGLCRVVGVKLMPRMRGISDAVFYRPNKAVRYRNIDALFGDEIDWELIATHARDMIQVALSIQAGRVMPSMLLRKLGSYSRKSLLYRAFRELGRGERTLFLLRYISSTEVRRVIRAETTKIEAYNDFLDWVCFGGPVVKSGDPVEQEKQLKYASPVANTVMLSNVADLTAVIADMARDGHPVTPELAAATSPHMREFGRFTLDMEDLPAPLNPQPLPFETPLWPLFKRILNLRLFSAHS